MSLSQQQIDHTLELFNGLGALTTRTMMGGLCIYSDGQIFAILHSDGSVWLKGAKEFAERLTGEGWERWTYSRDGKKSTAMPYWRLPEDALDDPDLACEWVRKALEHL